MGTAEGVQFQKLAMSLNHPSPHWISPFIIFLGLDGGKWLVPKRLCDPLSSEVQASFWVGTGGRGGRTWGQRASQAPSPGRE